MNFFQPLLGALLTPHPALIHGSHIYDQIPPHPAPIHGSHIYDQIGQLDLTNKSPTPIPPGGHHTGSNPTLTRAMPVPPSQLLSPKVPASTPGKLRDHCQMLSPISRLLQPSQLRTQVHPTCSINTRTLSPPTNPPSLFSTTLVWSLHHSNYLTNKHLTVSLVINHDPEVSASWNNPAHLRALLFCKTKPAAILAANQRPPTILTPSHIFATSTPFNWL